MAVVDHPEGNRPRTCRMPWRRHGWLPAILVGVALALLTSRGAALGFNRWVVLQGTVNFRDIGAYNSGTTATVATALAYRSAALDRITTSDATAIQALGIHLVLDIRSVPETASSPDSALLDAFTTHVLIPITFASDLPATATWQDHYRQLLLRHSEQWRQIFDILADRDNFPLDFHCQAGKDRTGILTALVLMCLGVDRETIISDYLLSNVAYGVTVVNRSYLEAVFEEIDARGGIEPYLDGIGVGETVRRAVRANLLAPRSAGANCRWALYR